MMEADAEWDDWKAEILQQLRQRAQQESIGCLTEPFTCHGHLQDQVESCNREITRLKYHNQELEQQVEELEKSGRGEMGKEKGTALTKANKRITELQKKLGERTEELVASSKQQNDYVAKVTNLMTQLRQRDDEVVKKDNRLRDFLQSQRKWEESKHELEEQLDLSLKSNQSLMDEHRAVQLVFSSMEEKNQELQKERDRFRSEMIHYKLKYNEKVTSEKQKMLQMRDQQLQSELAAATKTKERDPPPRQRLEHSLPEVLSAPSICPATPLCTLDDHENEVSALCFSPDGNYFASGGADKVVKVYKWRPETETMELKRTLQGSNASIMSVQFNQQSKQVLAASNDLAARIWTFHDTKPKHNLTGHTNKVMAARFLEDNHKVVTGSHDRTLKIWDLQLKTCQKTLFAGSSCNDVIKGLGSTIISGHFDKRIRFWDLRSTNANEINLQGKVTSLDLFPNRHLLLCCSRDHTLRLIDLRQNAITNTFSAPGFNVSVDWARACFSPDGQYVAAGSSDGTLFVWETLTGRPKGKKEHGRDVVVCDWHPKGQLFASGDRNKKVILWRR